MKELRMVERSLGRPMKVSLQKRRQAAKQASQRIVRRIQITVFYRGRPFITITGGETAPQG